MSAPAFSAKTIHEYLFSRNPTAPDTYRLDKAIVGRFCDVLEREITKHASMGPCYRYAFCDIGEDAMDAFFNSERDRFLDFGTYIVFLGTCSDEQARRIESRYDDPIVTEALRTARREARLHAQS